VAVLRVLAIPLVILVLVSVIVGTGIQVLDASGEVAGLCFMGLAVLAGILGGRVAEKWPVSSPPR
jgi:hypothetical protein